MSGDWIGQSLAFVRRIIQSTESYETADKAREASGKLLEIEPHVGWLCWYESWPHGNVAISVGYMVGQPHVLGINEWGDPALMPRNAAILGFYIGCTPTIGASDDSYAD